MHQHKGQCTHLNCDCEHYSHPEADSFLNRYLGYKCATCKHGHAEHEGPTLADLEVGVGSFVPAPCLQWSKVTVISLVLYCLPSFLAVACALADSAADVREHCPTVAGGFGSGWQSPQRYLVAVMFWPLIAGVNSIMDAKSSGYSNFFIFWFLIFGLIESLLCTVNQCLLTHVPLLFLAMLTHSVYYTIWIISMCRCFKLGLLERIFPEGWLEPARS